VCVCACVCVRACVDMCVCMCMCMCVCVYVCVYAHACMRYNDDKERVSEYDREREIKIYISIYIHTFI
jgi:hypothetical protein